MVQSINLRSEEVGGAFVPEYEIRQLDFSRKRQLLDNPLTGERTRQAALLQSSELLAFRTGYAHGEIKPILEGLLEEQGDLDHPRRPGFLSEGRPSKRIDQRMCKFLQKNTFRIVRKDTLRQIRPVDLARTVNDRGPKTLFQRPQHLGQEQNRVPNESV